MIVSYLKTLYLIVFIITKGFFIFFDGGIIVVFDSDERQMTLWQMRLP
jgi:hypothetical protein